MWYCWQTFVGLIIIINAGLFLYVLDEISKCHKDLSETNGALKASIGTMSRAHELAKAFNKKLEFLERSLEIPQERPGLSNDERYVLWQEWRKTYFCSCKKEENKVKE